MAKPFIDVSTGKEYDTQPEGTVRLGKQDDGTYIIKYNGEFLRVSADDPRIPKMYSENSTRQKQQSKFETKEETQKAIDEQVRRTAFTDDDTLNYWLDAMSVTHHLRAMYDGITDGSYQTYVNSLKHGNPGMFSKETYEEYPWLEVVNAGIDLGAPLGVSKFFRYATTPRMVGQGVSKEGWIANPFSRRVTLIGGDPAYMSEQSNIPRAAKYTYEGVTKDGRAVHTTPRLKIMKESPSKSFIQDMHRQGIFRRRMPGDTERVLFDSRGSRGNRIIADVEYGRNPFTLREYIVDGEPMPIGEYRGMMGYRRGGKLIPRKYIK